jgi:hypothetical protein
VSDPEKESARIMGSYAAAVLAKDVDAFMRLYHPTVRVFDAWGVWLYDGAPAWRIAVEGWFSTHPMEEDRISSTRAAIAQISPSILRTLSTDSQRYQSFKQRIRALPPSPTPRASR